MTPERWLRVKDEFALLAEILPAERSVRLAALDEDTREQVEKLLRNSEEAALQGSALDRPLVGSTALLEWFGEAQCFAPGEVLLDRFEVVELIGRGGMGEVYSATDRLSSIHIALKTIRFDLLSEQEVVRRFREESKRASAIVHPNVCRVGQFYSIPREDGDDLPFFEMELLSGETLHNRISRDGALPIGEALVIALEVCSALQAAHNRGVLHRDLKSSNIFLALENGVARTKLMDFGIARDLVSNDATVTSTTGSPVGTLAYMAPELLEGHSASIASDIYALGVVFYRMISGRYPFESDSDLVSAAMRIRRQPPPPRLYAATIPPHCERAILACLSSDPNRRPPTAELVADLLQGSASAVWARQKQLAQAFVGRRDVLASMLGTASVALSATVWTKWNAPPFKERAFSILVEDLRSADPGGALGRALRSMVRLSLSNVPGMTVVRAADVSLAAKQLSLGTEPIRDQVAVRVAHQTKADLLIRGDLTPRDHGLLLKLEAVAPESSKIYARSTAEVGDQISIASAVERTSAQIYERLSGANLATVRSAGPPLEPASSEDPDALEMFAAGLEHYQYGEIDTALRYLEESTRLDPNFAIAYVYQTQVHTALRHEDRAFPCAVKAYALRSSVTERQRLQAEVMYYSACGDIDRTIESQKRLVERYPTEAQLHRHLAQTLAMINRCDDSLEHARLAISLDPRGAINYMILASVLAQSGRYSEARRVLEDGHSRFPGAPVLLSSEATVGILEGKLVEALACLQRLEQRRGYTSHARAHRLRCQIVYGRIAEATTALDLEIGRAVELHDSAQEELARNWMGKLLLLQNRFDEAATQASVLSMRPTEPYNLFALRSASEIAHAAGSGTVLSKVAAKLQSIQDRYPSSRATSFWLQAEGLRSAMRGDLAGASTTLSKAAAFWSDVSNTWALAEILFRRGSFGGALPLYESIVERKGAAIRWEQQYEWVLSHIQAARCSREVGQIDLARKYFRTFLGLWGQDGQQLLVGIVRAEFDRLT